MRPHRSVVMFGCNLKKRSDMNFFPKKHKMHMKKARRRTVFILILTIPYLIYAQQQTELNPVTFRTVKIDSLPFQKIIATTTVKTSLSACVNLMFDVDAFPKWLHNCREARLLKKASQTSAYYMFIYKSFMQADRYIIADASLQQNAETGIVEFWAQDTQDEPNLTNYKIADAVQAEFFDALWRFTPVNGSIKIDYELYVDPGGIPKILAAFVESYVKSVTRKSLLNLQMIIQDEKYNVPNTVLFK